MNNGIDVTKITQGAGEELKKRVERKKRKKKLESKDTATVHTLPRNKRAKRILLHLSCVWIDPPQN